jgi:hypothetical protein
MRPLFSLLAAAFALRGGRAQITATVAVGTSLALPQQQYSSDDSSAHDGRMMAAPSLRFRPAGSSASVVCNGTSCHVPNLDRAGEYVVGARFGNSAAETLLHFQAVDLLGWANGSTHLMSDTFGAHGLDDRPADSATGMGFWKVLAGGPAGSCDVTESPRTGLLISVGGGQGEATAAAAPCGLQTRSGCKIGAAVKGCGFASGATTVNPFADKIVISLFKLQLAAPVASHLPHHAEPFPLSSSLRLTSAEGGVIDLTLSNDVVLRWAANATANQDEWTKLYNLMTPADCLTNGFQAVNLSLSLQRVSLRFSCNAGQVFGTNASVQHGIDWRSFAPSTGGELALSILGASRPLSGGHHSNSSISLARFEVSTQRRHGHLRALLAPIPNLNGGATGSPFLGAGIAGSLEKLLSISALGYLDATLPPFSADPTGATDSTVGLQAAIHYARRNYLSLYLPSGEYLVSQTLVAKQTERLDAVDGTNGYWQQARYVPNRIVGSSRATTRAGKVYRKAVLVLAPNTFTDVTKPAPVVWMWMQNSEQKSQPNANCNQIFMNVDIRISMGNPGAMGIRARGAQMMVVQDVTIVVGDGLLGLSGGSGSGGSHYGVTVVGGRYGIDYTTAQPGPVITGFTLVNQTCSALVYAGLQTLTAVGLRISSSAGMRQPAILSGCNAATNMVPSWWGAYFGEGCELPQFVLPSVVQPCQPANSGPISLVDSVIDLGGQLKAAVAADASILVKNTWVRTAATNVFEFKDGNGSLAAATTRWTVIGEYARGVSRHSSDPEDPEGPGIKISSGIHMLSGSTLQPLGSHDGVGARAPNFTSATTLLVAVHGTEVDPDPQLTTQHLYAGRTDALPSFESAGAVVAAECCAATPDGVHDQSHSLSQCLKLASQSAIDADKVCVLGRGIYRLSETLVIPSGVSLVGAGLHLTSLVPTSTGFAGTPVLRAVGGATIVMGISISVWAHYDSVTAVYWGAGLDSLWIQNHVNRMDECGISGGTPLNAPHSVLSTDDLAILPAAAASAPALVPPLCRTRRKLGRPLVLVQGSGSFYNFYNEDAMGTMVAADYQLPDYRHILVKNAVHVRFYHFNPEHSVSNANSEFLSSSHISVFGTKSEGHSATIWVRNCSDVFHSGHAGNANPESCDPETCTAWTPSPCACNW